MISMETVVTIPALLESAQVHQKQVRERSSLFSH